MGTEAPPRSATAVGSPPDGTAVGSPPDGTAVGRPPDGTAIGSPPPPDVVVARWPEEAERVDRLRRDHVPRLLLVAEGEPPPASADCEEDWVRLPADDADVRARLIALSGRSARHLTSRGPEVDLAGRVRFRGRWVALSKTEVRLARLLVDDLGHVVSYDDLWRSGWPGEDVEHGGQLRIQILRLRRRLEPIGLSIRTVNGIGYVLEATAADSPR